MIIDGIRIESIDLIDTTGTKLGITMMLDMTAGANGYLIKAVDGFEPSENYEYAEGLDSTSRTYRDNIPENKELTIKVEFIPGVAGTISSLRDLLYRITSRPVAVYLMNDGLPVAYITGVIRKPEVAHSTNVPEVVLSIKCDDGLFSGVTENDVSVVGLSKTLPYVDYTVGTAPAPFSMAITLTANRSGLTLYGYDITRSMNTWYLSVNYSFLAGDIVEIITDQRSRSISRTRSGAIYNITGNVIFGSSWPKLRPIRNYMKFNTTSFDWVSIKYTDKFWGV